jgi:hypothetical protein
VLRFLENWFVINAVIKVRTRESAGAGSSMMDPEKNTQDISVSWPACFCKERARAYGFRLAASATYDRRPPIAVQCNSQPLLLYLVIYWPLAVIPRNLSTGICSRPHGKYIYRQLFYNCRSNSTSIRFRSFLRQ